MKMQAPADCGSLACYITPYNSCSSQLLWRGSRVAGAAQGLLQKLPKFMFGLRGPEAGTGSCLIVGARRSPRWPLLCRTCSRL